MSLTKLYKTLFSALLGIALLVPALPARAAGTLPIAMAQQIDINGQPLAGCIVNFFVAGTVSSPQNSYSDFGLTLNPNNVLNCDQSGRVPMFWLADGLIHVRMTDASGVPVIDTTMQVLGPSTGGGGGGGTVDPTTIMATGDMKARYGTGAIAGFVRANGLTIGNASCGCSERSNADTQALWVYLYTTDPNLAVSGGRTGNALNDYNANKQLTTPDWRGRALAFLDDMGNSPAARLTASYFGTSATVLGAAGGAENQTLQVTEMPAHNHGGLTGSPTINLGTFQASGNAGAAGGNTRIVINGLVGLDSAASFSTFQLTPPSVSGSAISSQGGSSPHRTVQPTMLATIYVKL